MEEFHTLLIWVGKGKRQGWTRLCSWRALVPSTGQVHTLLPSRSLFLVSDLGMEQEAFISHLPSPSSDLTTTSEVSTGPRELGKTQARVHPCFCLFQH